MSMIKEYIDKAERALESDADEDERELVVKDIVSVFGSRIPSIKDGLDRYRARASFVGERIYYDNAGDLRKLLSKLKLLQEEDEHAVAVDPVLGAKAKLDRDIERCEKTLKGENDEQCGRLAERLVYVYQADVESIGFNLDAFF